MNTQINIDAPTEAYIGESFPISGVLEVLTETGWAPLSNKPIDIYISNQYLGTVTTNNMGAYWTTAAINEAGSYMLKSSFQGEDTEEPGAIPWVPLLLLLGAILVVRS